MLPAFLSENRAVHPRPGARQGRREIAPRASQEELEKGIPLFIDQLIALLVVSQTSTDAMVESATRHGRALFEGGLHRGPGRPRLRGRVPGRHRAGGRDERAHHARRVLRPFIAASTRPSPRPSPSTCAAAKERSARWRPSGWEPSPTSFRNALGVAMLAFQTLRAGKVGIGGSTASLVDRSLRAPLRARRVFHRARARRLGQAPASTRLVARAHRGHRGRRLHRGQRARRHPVGRASRTRRRRGGRPTAPRGGASAISCRTRSSSRGPRGRCRCRRPGRRIASSSTWPTSAAASPPGIPRRCFARSSSEARTGPGWGWGSRSVARASKPTGGMLRVRDIPGTGCVFTIELAEARPRALTIRLSRPSHGKVRGGGWEGLDAPRSFAECESIWLSARCGHDPPHITRGTAGAYLGAHGPPRPRLLPGTRAAAQSRGGRGAARDRGLPRRAEDGAFHWKVAIALLAEATTLWLIASRALGQYDAANGRGFLGDVALTLVMLAAVVAPIGGPDPRLSALRADAAPGARPRRAAADRRALRVRVVGLRLCRSRPIADVLVVGTGPLGRLTGAELDDGQTRRRVLGYLRFDDEAPHARLHAPVFGTVDDLEATLRERAVDEVYFASTAGEHNARGAGRDPDVRDARRARSRSRRAPTGSPGRGSRPRARSPTGTRTSSACSVKPLAGVMKRLFDIAVSAAALALLSPLLVVRRGPGEAHLAGARPLQAGAGRPARAHVPHAQVPLDGGERRGAQGAAPGQRTSRAARSSR